MNRKQKITVSIIGITIVALALLGITYAYYLTRIQGNTNTNSISITTADLKLSYGDGNEIITALNIVPNTTIAEKTFTVTNTGNSTIENYRVILELASIEGVVPSVYKYPNDFEITLTCVSKNNTTNEVSGSCNGYTGKWNNESFEMQKNTIAEGIRHEYSLVIKYVDSGIDQSDDMGKNLNLKVQIYGETDTSTLNGTITGVDSTYAMKLNSKPKVSILKPTSNTGEYRYSFIGVEPGTHTLSLVNKNGEVVSSETITINKGTNASVNGSTITVKENQSTIHLTTSSSGNTLSSTATFNPYATNTLAYNIINNAKTNKNGTIYSDVPLTTPAVEISGVTNYKTTGEEATYANTMSSVSSNASKIWYYYDTYEVDASTGKFTLTGKQSCTYSSCYENLKDKYLYSTSASDNSNANNHTADTKTNLSNVYKVTATTSSTLSYVTIFNSPNEAERVLAPTTDDYGISYYYRGDIEDNYVNFAGMCWRIVRIEGDGSVKLLLEDRYTTCDDTEDDDGTGTADYKYTGDWSDGNTYVFGYDDNYRVDFLNYSEGLADSFKIFQTSKLTSTDIEKLKIDEWCYDDKVTLTQSWGFDEDYNQDFTLNNYTDEYYGAYTRINTNKKPSLNCSGTKLTEFKDGTDMYVATLTADEMSFAGATTSTNYNYYLMNNYSKYGSKGLFLWSLSPFRFYDADGYGLAFFLGDYGELNGYDVYAVYCYRPAVTLKAGSVITGGEGTLEKPYIIE